MGERERIYILFGSCFFNQNFHIFEFVDEVLFQSLQNKFKITKFSIIFISLNPYITQINTNITLYIYI